MLVTTTNTKNDKGPGHDERRFSSQSILPQRLEKRPASSDEYQLFPFHPLGEGKIFTGYETLAAWISSFPTVIIDGYSGIFWEDLRYGLSARFAQPDLVVQWIDISSCLKSEDELATVLGPFLGPADSLWGKRCDLELVNFFEPGKLASVQREERAGLTIVYGTGAALLNWPGVPVVYMDLPKNEIQYRMRAGAVTNLGSKQPGRPTEMYKRCYFIDWVVLNRHKKDLLHKAAVFADAQWAESISWMKKDTLHAALKKMSKSVIRARPWFEAGAWGGQWMKHCLKGLNKEEVNYAWSFELITPENGIVFESNDNLLELSFDYLMFADNKALLGINAEIFGDEFPIRFDFLDTWNGGNLSIQCHPTLAYIRENFGEKITQDETYYILDCQDGARVYLGFQEDIEPGKFLSALEHSRNNNEVVAIEKYVQALPAKKHDLFLIPNGTVHSAGANNVVLEISATPYIFTFKMYDWLRLDLNGEPRAINIGHAFKNLNFERKGEQVRRELVATPSILKEGEDWQLIHLPTHTDHFYDVHRIEFDNSVTITTEGSCHVLMLVEGTSVCVTTDDGSDSVFHYAETFVIPAAALAYRLSNPGKTRLKVVKAFLKENIDFLK